MPQSGVHSSTRGRKGSSQASQKVNPYQARDQVIDLTQQESGWAMMTSPSNSVVSIFEETSVNTMRLDKIYDRVSEMVRMNPWLTCRLRMTPNGIKAVYGNEFVDCFEAVSRMEKINVAQLSYGNLVNNVLQYTVKSGECCVDKDEPLFKVTAISGASADSPLKQLCVVLSVSSVIADAPTMYSFFSMLDPDTRPFKLETARNEHYIPSIKAVLGSAQLRWLKSTGMWLGEWLMSWRAKPHQSAVYTISNDWLKRQKEDSIGEGVDWVSTNDVLTSWFMNMTRCDFGFINVNFRRFLDLHKLQENELLAGRYVHHILFRRNNFNTPACVRKSIPTSDNKKKCQPDIPNFVTTAGRNSCLVSNYASITPKFCVPGCTLMLHIPILIRDKDRNFEQYSRWKTSGYYKNEMIIFKSTETSHGILVFGRGLKLNSYLKQKNGPFAAAITTASVKIT